jgi:hypothetical protein
MARFNTTGVDEIIADMKRMGELAGPTAQKMLMAGAEEVKIAWKASAEAHGHRDYGDMIASINFPRKVSNAGEILSIDIYPQGKDRKGVRNAEKAFILHYGSSRIPASHWVDVADAMAGPRVQKVMEEIWDEHLKGK